MIENNDENVNENENENINFDSMFPNKEAIEDYIKQNKPLDIRDDYGDTLLMQVCFKEYQDIALQMLDYGPKAVNLSFLNEENNNLTALSISCVLRLKKVIMKMLDFGPEETNINSQDIGGDTCLMLLLQEVSQDNDLLDCIFKILDFGPRGLNLGLVNDNGYTALMLACEYKLKEVILKMLENPDFNLNLFQEINGDTAYDIAFRNNLDEITQLLRERMQEEEAYHIEIPSSPTNTNTNINKNVQVKDFYVGTMQEIPKEEEVEKYNKINVNQNGWDPFQMENENILKYLTEDKQDNIAIRYLDKIYLTKRSIVKQQQEEATVFECLEGNNKLPENIVYNLPLYNIKKIGINISSDNAVGLEPEYIYMDSILKILQSNDSKENMFAIIPLDKILVSVISWEEVQKLKIEFTGASSLHCQAGQGGLTGIIIPAVPINTGGRGKTLKKKKSLNKKKTLKKKKSLNKKKNKSLKKNKKNKKKNKSQFRKK
jgi:ankyrin repeat protein